MNHFEGNGDGQNLDIEVVYMFVLDDRNLIVSMGEFLDASVKQPSGAAQE